MGLKKILMLTSLLVMLPAFSSADERCGMKYCDCPGLEYCIECWGPWGVPDVCSGYYDVCPHCNEFEAVVQ